MRRSLAGLEAIIGGRGGGEVTGEEEEGKEVSGEERRFL